LRKGSTQSWGKISQNISQKSNWKIMEKFKRNNTEMKKDNCWTNQINKNIPNERSWLDILLPRKIL
jgi:hypothetical protein